MGSPKRNLESSVLYHVLVLLKLKVSHSIIRKYEQTLHSLPASLLPLQIFIILSIDLCPGVGRRELGASVGMMGTVPVLPASSGSRPACCQWPPESHQLGALQVTLQANRHKAQRIMHKTFLLFCFTVCQSELLEATNNLHLGS